MRNFDLLIIEDHLTMVEGYKGILDVSFTDFKMNYVVGSCFEEAEEHINDHSKKIDMAIVDISLKRGGERHEFSGRDLGLLLRKVRPQTKIIIITSHIEKIVLYSIYKEVNPEGILVKSDFGPKELIEAVRSVLDSKYIYTETFDNCVKELNQEVYLDSTNRNIIFLISKGVQTKNLTKHLSLSVSAIDKRKAIIKDVLGVTGGSDEDIIRESKRRGFV